MYYWWKCKLIQPLWKTVWRFLKKLKIERLHDPAIPRLGVQRKLNPYLRESSAPPCSLQRTHNCRDPERRKCARMNEWIKKTQCTLVSTMKYYSAIKNKEILPFATTWIDFDKYCKFSLICKI